VTASHRTHRPPLFTLRTLVILSVSLLVGLGIGSLTYVSKRNVADAVLAGVTAFGASLVAMHQLVE
jgi:hypothetical protein